MLVLVAHYDLELEQMDVGFNEIIYMIQPHRFIDSGKSDYVCLLKRSLYGLKQSPSQ